MYVLPIQQGQLSFARDSEFVIFFYKRWTKVTSFIPECYFLVRTVRLIIDACSSIVGGVSTFFFCSDVLSIQHSCRASHPILCSRCC